MISPNLDINDLSVHLIRNLIANLLLFPCIADRLRAGMCSELENQKQHQEMFPEWFYENHKYIFFKPGGDSQRIPFILVYDGHAIRATLSF